MQQDTQESIQELFDRLQLTAHADRAMFQWAQPEPKQVFEVVISTTSNPFAE
ncbi:hypothetical protein GCM10028789_15900 [Sinomonas halotolerans]